MDVAGINAFLEKLIATAIEAGAEPNSVNFDNETGLLSMSMKGADKAEEPRQMIPAALYQKYITMPTDDARAAFLAACVQTYVKNMAQMPLDWKKAAPLLRPRLQTAKYFRAKQRALPQGESIPFCALDGSEGKPLLDAMQTPEDALGVCVVADFGQALVPVLSSHLSSWGKGGKSKAFDAALGIAQANLGMQIAQMKAKAGKGKGKGGGSKKNQKEKWNKWQKHPSGCCISRWNDHLSATRVAVLPSLALLARPGCMQEEGSPQAAQEAAAVGDIVAVFSAQGEALAAASRNPVSLCFMGDTALQRAAEAAKMTAEDKEEEMSKQVTGGSSSGFLSAVPYRLTTAAPRVAGKPHPMEVDAGNGKVWKWVKYVRAEGEFSVPKTQSQIDAILDGMQKGKVPVFGEDLVDETAELADELKVKGNAAFSKGDFHKAIKHYTAAIKVRSNEVLYSNRAICFLKLSGSANLSCAAEDAAKAVAIKEDWAKGWMRQAQVFEAQAKHLEARRSAKRGLQCTLVPDGVRKSLQLLASKASKQVKKQKSAAEERKRQRKLAEEKEQDRQKQVEKTKTLWQQAEKAVRKGDHAAKPTLPVSLTSTAAPPIFPPQPLPSSSSLASSAEGNPSASSASASAASASAAAPSSKSISAPTFSISTDATDDFSYLTAGMKGIDSNIFTGASPGAPSSSSLAGMGINLDWGSIK